MKRLAPLAAFVLAACAAAPSAEPQLHGHWQVQTLHNAAPPAAFVIRLTPEGRLAVRGGCNLIGSEYHAGNGHLTFSEPFSTKMACEPHRMRADEAIGAVLVQVAGYRIDGGTLTLTDRNGQPLLQAKPAAGTPR